MAADAWYVAVAGTGYDITPHGLPREQATAHGWTFTLVKPPAGVDKIDVAGDDGGMSVAGP
jgi:hypothetical protein